MLQGACVLVALFQDFKIDLLLFLLIHVRLEGGPKTQRLDALGHRLGGLFLQIRIDKGLLLFLLFLFGHRALVLLRFSVDHILEVDALHTVIGVEVVLLQQPIQWAFLAPRLFLVRRFEEVLVLVEPERLRLRILSLLRGSERFGFLFIGGRATRGV